MVDFKTLCEKYGIDLGEQAEDFTRDLFKNYKSVEEVERAKSKLEKAEADLATSRDEMAALQEQLSSFAGTADEIASIKAENEAYRKREDERARAAEQAKIDSIIDKQIAEVVGDREFANAYVERAFKADMRTAIADEVNADKTVGEIFASLSNDVDGLFKPGAEIVTDFPGAPDAHPGVSEAASGSSKRENRDIFADWFDSNFKGII